MIRRLLELLDAGRLRPTVKRSPNGDSALAPPTTRTRREVLFPLAKKNGATVRWMISADAERCTDCMACVRICHSRALQRREGEEEVSYRFDVLRCDGCNDCSQVCAENAVRVAQAERASETPVVVRLAVRPCRQCGRPQAGLVNGRCAACRQNDARMELGGVQPR